MLNNLEGARLGIFVFLGTVLIILIIFLVGNKDSLFVETIQIRTYFHNVEGLRNGATVRLSGIDIGSVSQIGLENDTTGRVEVTMRIQNTARKFVRVDSKATIETEGLVGKKLVVISVGSNDMEIVPENGIIHGKDPMNIAAVIEETQVTLSYIKSITKDFSEIVTKINEGTGTIGQLVNDEALYASTVDITRSANTSLISITEKMENVSDLIIELGTDFKSVVSNIDSTAIAAKVLVGDIKEGKGFLGSLIVEGGGMDSINLIIQNFIKTSEETKIAAGKLTENMEALKHNWLFKNYFEQRGYWDKAEFEKDLDDKILMIKTEQNKLDARIEELRKLEESLNK